MKSQTSIRLLVTINIVLCCMCSFAQNIDLDKALKDVYNEYWATEIFDKEKAEDVVSLVSEQNYSSLSDSAKYCFHYLSTGLCSDKKDFDNELIHVNEAVKLHETSIGILCPEYLELLMEQGSLNEKKDIEKSISIYQKGLIVGQTILGMPSEPKFNFRLMATTYGNLMGFLANLYEKKGWTNSISELYLTAFRHRSVFSPIDDPRTYIELHELSNYYVKNNEITKSIDLLEREANYIKENGYYASSAYVETLYYLGSSYSKANQKEKSLDSYRTALEIACDSLGSKEDLLYFLYSNYIQELVDQNQFKVLDYVLPKAKKYYSEIDSIQFYAKTLYGITEKVREKRLYDKANEYCDSLLLYQSYLGDYLDLIYSQKALIEYNRYNLEFALEWKEKELEYNKKRYGIDNYFCFNNMNDIALLYHQLDKPEESIKEYLTLTSLLEKNNCDSIPLFTNVIFNLYDVYVGSNNENVGYSMLLDSKLNSSNKYGTRTLVYAIICNFLSVEEIKKGKLIEAQKNNKIAEQIFAELEGLHSGNYSTALHNKGRILQLLGKYKQAYSVLLDSKQIQIEVYGDVSPKTEQYIKEVETALKK